MTSTVPLPPPSDKASDLPSDFPSRPFYKSGVFLMLLGSLAFTVMSALAKRGATAVPFMDLVFYRNFIGFVVLTPFLLRPLIRRGVRRPGLLLARSVFGFLGLSTTFYGISKLPLSDSMLLFNTVPLFVIILARLFLKEPLKREYPVILAISMVGVLIILRPGLDVINFAGAVQAGGAINIALAYILLRRLAGDDDPFIIVYGFHFLTALFSLTAVGFSLPIPPAEMWPTVVGVGVTGALGQVLLTLAYRADPAGRVALANYAGIPIGVLLGWLFWSEIPDGYTIAGGVLIVSGLAGLALTGSGPTHGERPEKHGFSHA